MVASVQSDQFSMEALWITKGPTFHQAENKDFDQTDLNLCIMHMLAF